MDSAVVFLLVLTRITSMMLTAPLFGSQSIPFKIRFGLSLVIAVSTFSLVPADHVSVNHSLTSGFLSELIIGLMLGLGILIVFSAAQLAGTVISQMAGIQLPGNFDPQSGQSVSAVGQLFSLLSLAAFTLIGGPELLLTSTLDSFHRLPLGGNLNIARPLSLMTELLQQSFVMTLRGVAPAVASMLTATLVVGWISRSFPQLNLLGLGLSSNLLLMFLAISFTLGGCVWLFVDDLDQFIFLISNSLKAASFAQGAP